MPPLETQAHNPPSSLALMSDPPKPSRLLSLDVFRGLTVALMILVDDIGGLIPAINHSPWNGATLADFVMPFFLFIVGVSLGLTYKKLTCSKLVATKTALLRALKLLIVGLVIQGGFFHGLHDLTYGVNIQSLRLMGTLQRIAIAYLSAALCEIWLVKRNNAATTSSNASPLKKYRYQWVLAFLLATIYVVLLYALYVPDWEYKISSDGFSRSAQAFSVKCGVRGDTSPACNAVGMVDRKILGIQHLYMKPGYRRTMQCSTNSPNSTPPSWCQAPFDPEGLLSSVMAIVTCLIGLHYGHIIVHFKDHNNRILHWVIPAAILAFVGFCLHMIGLPVNKNLYSLSYTCVTAGAAGLLFAGIYVLVDVCGYKRPTWLLEWMGRHSLMLYILAACNILPMFLHGFYWKKPENNILRLIGIRS
ncbi:hypothetical protein Scep_012602 [Stephania cephalantha]|uniref:Heparan-alpha-glucosaminide N-acetyltransferase catalytic domain-containing protein n=1 Tax=Stephania cephalantha TaxID=152367 RepID=A0AAP0P7P4_9MAGN